MGMGEEPPARRENGRRRRRWTDGDDDEDDEEYVADEEEEEEDFAEELAASSAGEEGEDSDAEYQEDEEEEEEEETPRPKRPVKGSARGRKGKTDPRAKRRRYEEEDDYEEEPSEDEEPNEEDEVEESDEETPRPKRPVKGGARGRKGKMDPATPQARRRRYEADDDYEEPDEDEEPDIDEEVEEYHEEIEEEEPPPRPQSAAKCVRRDQNVELARSHRRKYEEDDMDFEPELDEEEEVDEDIDFDPDIDDEDEDEFEDEEEEEFGATRARKVAVKSPAKRKSASKRRSLKKKKANKGSKTSKRKKGSAKAKKSTVRRVRKRFVVNDSDDDSEDDDDFIMDDQVEVNRHPRKKARTGTSKQTELEHPSFVEEGTWPNVESETSEFEFVTSDDEPDDAGTAVVEANSVRKRRKKRKSGSESSSDSEFIVSDKELENLGETESPKLLPALPTPIIRKNSIVRHGEDKGKEKEEPEEAGKPICGICLSEGQIATVQGVLNCCSHYFCFACIIEWSRVESRCPLCKQRFTTITKSSKADLGLALRKAIIKVEERDQVYQPTEEEIRRWLDPYENVVCIECNQGGDDSLMLLCDICDSSAHTYCVGLGREVPEGNWYCGGCRLSEEGPSHARTPHTVGYERQSYRNHVDFTPVGFGVAAGTFDRSSSLNRRRSFQGIDLNLSPREAPGEIHPAESQASPNSVSTPTGRRATLSGRRQIHRYIRILLTRPRQSTTTTRLEDMLPSFAPRNGAVPRTELNHHSFRSSSEANTSQITECIQNQHNGIPFAPSMPLDGDEFPHIEGVKSNLRNV
ncbi:hypothetical protein QOZ80_3BG0282930 [Eleusine coracana subsp. coracana]|nr:hypothetical protein QOZ80_3BG0282930 [Eleusine coracana subsp. coracana]